MKKLVSLLLIGVFSCSSIAYAKEETIYKWEVETKVSALTDKTQVVAILDSNDDEDIALVVRCFEGELDIYLSSEDEFAESETQNIAVRLDKGAVINMEWLTGDDYTAAFVTDVASFANSLQTAEKLILGFQPMTGIQQVAIFDIKGFDKVYGKAAAVCGK